MARTFLNTEWAGNTTNKINMSDEEFSRGILFESSVESKIPNQALYVTSKAVKEIMEYGATLYIEGKNYPQGSIVLVMINIDSFISQRMYMKIGAETNTSFPMQTKEIYQTLGQSVIYKLHTTNTQDWQEITGYASADLIADYQNNRVYMHGETCYIYVDIATQDISLSKPSDIGVKWRKVLISSSIDNNNVAPSRDSLTKVWFVEDGYEIGQGKIDLSNRMDNYQLGYFLVNNNNLDTIYNFADYPRIEYMFKALNLVAFENFSVFQKIDDYTFKIRGDMRGYFMRIFRNEREDIDNTRIFYELQNPALPNITGRSIIEYSRNSGYGGWAVSLMPKGSEGQNADNLFSANNSSPIYTDYHNDVTPYNFNVNLLVKV